MNITTKTPQKSSNPLKFSQTRGNSERLTDRKITSPIETRISRIKANFAKINQNDANFAAHISVIPVQKINFSGGVA